jgi:RPA family protein
MIEEALLARQGFDLAQYRVIYRDTRGIWDQILVDPTGHFAGFSSLNERELSAALARLTPH